MFFFVVMKNEWPCACLYVEYVLIPFTILGVVCCEKEVLLLLYEQKTRNNINNKQQQKIIKLIHSNTL